MHVTNSAMNTRLTMYRASMGFFSFLNFFSYKRFDHFIKFYRMSKLGDRRCKRFHCGMYKDRDDSEEEDPEIEEQSRIRATWTRREDGKVFKIRIIDPKEPTIDQRISTAVQLLPAISDAEAVTVLLSMVDHITGEGQCEL